MPTACETSGLVQHGGNLRASHAPGSIARSASFGTIPGNMKTFLSPKKGGGALVDTHSSSGVELRGLGGDAAPSWDADVYTNPFADEPFAPNNPFLDAAPAPGSDHDLVEEILRDHQGLGPAAVGTSTSEAGFHRRSRSPAASSDLGGDAAATAGAAGVGGSSERLGSMHDVPLYDAAAAGDTAPHSPPRPWPKPTAASAATAAVVPPPRLLLSPLASGGGGGGSGSNPFLNSGAESDTAEQHPPGSSSNPFLLEEGEEPVLLQSPPSSFSWSKKERKKGASGRGSTETFAPPSVEPFELATPSPQPATGSRRSLLASEWEGPGGWGVKGGSRGPCVLGRVRGQVLLPNCFTSLARCSIFRAMRSLQHGGRCLAHGLVQGMPCPPGLNAVVCQSSPVLPLPLPWRA